MSNDKNHIVKIDGGAIVIQSCDNKTANIGVFYKGCKLYCHVSIPLFSREWKLRYYNELPFSEYDRILKENETILLERISAFTN